MDPMGDKRDSLYSIGQILPFVVVISSCVGIKHSFQLPVQMSLSSVSATLLSEKKEIF